MTDAEPSASTLHPEEPRYTARQAAFVEFFVPTEAAINRALLAAFGPDLARDATSEAFTEAWSDWDRIQNLDNPAGYVYRIAERWAMRQRRHHTLPDDPIPDPTEPSGYEPALADCLNRLTLRQRQAVMLVHGGGCTYAETANLLGIGLSTVQTHVARGIEALRAHMGVEQ